jgi:hypothetical protein
MEQKDLMDIRVLYQLKENSPKSHSVLGMAVIGILTIFVCLTSGNVALSLVLIKIKGNPKITF